MKGLPELRIVFRKSNMKTVNRYGEVFNNYYIDAILIDSMPENNNNFLTCYAHVGQHSTCCVHWLYDVTKVATQKEYKALLNELTGIYHDYELKVISRLPAKSSLRLGGQHD